MSTCIDTNSVLKRIGLIGGESGETALKRLGEEGARIWSDWPHRRWSAVRVLIEAAVQNRLRPVLAREVVDAAVRGGVSG